MNFPRPKVKVETPLYLSALDASRPDLIRVGERSTCPEIYNNSRVKFDRHKPKSCIAENK